MSGRIRFVAAVLLGTGLGAVGGGYVGTAAVWSGAGVALVGLVFFVVTPGATVGDASAGQPDGGEPPLAGLGRRVEDILRQAEDQADEYRRDAERQAQQILSAARSEARDILDRARTEAGGQAGPTLPA